LSSAANAAANYKGRGLGKPETFNFLGYVFFPFMLAVALKRTLAAKEDFG